MERVDTVVSSAIAIPKLNNQTNATIMIAIFSMLYSPLINGKI